MASAVATRALYATSVVPRRVPPPPAFHADLFTVGVTGTNGKTTTTAWIAAALHALADGSPVSPAPPVSRPIARATTVGFFLHDTSDERLAIERSYDGFIAGMAACHARGGTHAAIELTSEALALGFARAWPCQVGVFTNLSHDHLDAHGSAEHYLASKAQLFVALPPGGRAVLNASDAVFDLLREIIPAGVDVWSYAVPSRGEPHPDADLVATSVEVGWRGTRIRCTSRDETLGLPAEIHVMAIGEVFAENALAALLGAVAAGVPPHVAADALARAPVPPGRFEVIHEAPYVVVDYAHSPDALARTISTARTLAGENRLFVVFGAGGGRDRAKRPLMGEAAGKADVVVLTSDNPRDEDPVAIANAVASGLDRHPDVRTVLDRAEAICMALREARADDVVLVAGKGHESEQVIGNDAHAFSDVRVARDALASLAKTNDASRRVTSRRA